MTSHLPAHVCTTSPLQTAPLPLFGASQFPMIPSQIPILSSLIFENRSYVFQIGAGRISISNPYIVVGPRGKFQYGPGELSFLLAFDNFNT
jgi:hypothetical protein